MLSGANGSGKSTILSQLHPYKESFDDRKQLITDGEDGIKEVDIYNGSIFYEIKHIYATTAQSFIKRNGIELNPNGGVKTCEEIISKELGITKNYFNIGKIGSNTKSFIEFTTTERKNYIGTFLNIDEITSAAKIVKEKALSLSKDITNLGLELKDLPEEAALLEKLDKNTETLNSIAEALKELYIKNGSIQAEIDGILKELSEIQIESVESLYKEKSRDLTINKHSISSFEETYDDIPDDIQKHISEMTENLNKINIVVAENDVEIKNIKASIEDAKNSKEKAVIARNACKSPEELAKLEKELDSKKLELDEIDGICKSSKFYSSLKELMVSESITLNVVSEKHRAVLDFIQAILKEFAKYKSGNIFKLETNYHVFLSQSNVTEILQTQLKSFMTVKTQLEERLTLLRENLNKERLYADKVKSLEYRPSECTINTCPFIKEAFDHKDAEENIKTISNQISVAENDLKSCNNEIENIEYLITLYKDFTYYYDKNKIATNPLIKIFCENIGIESIDKLITPETSEGSIQTSYKEFKEGIQSLINSLIECLNLKQSYNLLKKDYELIKSSDSEKMRERYSEEIDLCDKKISELTTKLEEFERRARETKSDRDTLNNLVNAYTTYATSKNIIDNLQVDVEKLAKDISKHSELSKKRIDLDLELSEIKNKISKLLEDEKYFNKENQNINNEIFKIRNINEKLEVLKEKYHPVSVVQEALSTSKGIPLILMQLYLERTELITNELLNLAFDGEFEIAFKTSAKDFFIQVRAKENIKNDIKLASQGETSLTAISLSLALIEQSIGAYNILCLDEIDGPLDKKNREKFINILNSQIDKLGIEQVFIISHNDAFDACEMNLILLNGSTVDVDNAAFMRNKKILYANG